MKISVSSYSFDQYLKSGKLTLCEVIAKAKEIGFEAIEFTDLDKTLSQSDRLSLAKKLRRTAEENGITVCAYAIGANLFKTGHEFDSEFDRIKGEIDIAKTLGAPILRHDETFDKPGIGKKAKSFGLMLPVLIENTIRITEYAAEYGIRTCTENHGYTCQDSYRMEQLFSGVNNSNFGLLVDIGNFACVDEDSVLAVSRVAPYAIHAHAKDFIRFPYDSGKDGFVSRGGNILEGVAVGCGIIPVGQCVKALALAGYDGFISVEYEGKDDCIEGIKTSYKNLKSYINKTGL